MLPYRFPGGWDQWSDWSEELVSLRGAQENGGGAAHLRPGLIALIVLMFLLLRRENVFEQTAGRFPAQPAGLFGCRDNGNEKVKQRNKRKITSRGRSLEKQGFPTGTLRATLAESASVCVAELRWRGLVTNILSPLVGVGPDFTLGVHGLLPTCSRVPAGNDAGRREETSPPRIHPAPPTLTASMLRH